MWWGNKSLFKQSLSLEPKGRWPWKLVCSIGCSSTTKFDPELMWTYFTARSNLVPYAFVWEKDKTMDFSETNVVIDLKLATDDRSKTFLLTSKLSPLQGCMLPALGLYICSKSWKNCIKSDFKEISWKTFFLKLATNEWSDKTFLLKSKLCPLGAVCPCPGAIYPYM